MPTEFRLLATALLLSFALAAQIANNQSLAGRYFFRYVAFRYSGSTLSDVRSAGGAITFNGSGGYTIQGQQLIGNVAASPLTVSGTYAVRPGGFLTLSNPASQEIGSLDGRLAANGLLASSSGASQTFDLFVAIPAATQTTNASLAGNFNIATLEFPGAGLSQIRNAYFAAGPNGAGGVGNVLVEGQAANLGPNRQSQTLTGLTYAMNNDGSGILTVPAGGGQTTATQLVAGQKTIYLSADGSTFLGGSFETGLHGIVLGVRAFASDARQSSLSGLYWAAGLQFRNNQPVSFVGSANATGAGNLIWYHKRRELGLTQDYVPLTPYNLGLDGSGSFFSNRSAVGATGDAFFSTGILENQNSQDFWLRVGLRMPPQSGSGVFINPQGIFNGASFAPPGAPLAPGTLVTIFGTSLATQTAVAQSLPFPASLGGVQLVINGRAAPVYAVSPGQISGLIPFATTGPTATLQVIANAQASNTVEIPIAASSPGFFTVTRNGIGEGAILDTNFQLISASNPARRGSFVQLFLTGLGVTAPPVPDGAAAPASPLSQTNAAVRIFIGGVEAPNVTYKGLAPGLAGLYQINVQIPVNAPPGVQPLAIQTAEAFVDLADIRIQ
jgi:uncharacterized protein (TIGR03437 family)